MRKIKGLDRTIRSLEKLSPAIERFNYFAKRRQLQREIRSLLPRKARKQKGEL